MRSASFRGKSESLTLGGTVVETPVGMEEGKGEITGWETVEGGDASAEL